MNSFKKNKGITLIALVITIIVMLILVAVTINIAVNGGLFDYAGKAARKTEEAKNDEKDWAKLNENMSTDELIAKYTTSKKEDLERLKQIFEGKTEEEVDIRQFTGKDELSGIASSDSYRLFTYHNNMYRFTIEGGKYTKVELLDGIQYEAILNGKYLGQDEQSRYYKYNNKRYKITFNESIGEYSSEEYIAELKEVTEHESEYTYTGIYMIRNDGVKKGGFEIKAYQYEDMEIVSNDVNGYITVDGPIISIEGNFNYGYTTTITLKGLQSGKTKTVTITV